MPEELHPILVELTLAVRELREAMLPRQVTSLVTVTPELPERELKSFDEEESALSLLSPLSSALRDMGIAGTFDSPVYRVLFQTLRNAQSDYKSEVTFINYEPDVRQKLLEFRAEEDSYLLLTGLKFNYALLKSFYAVFQIYVNDEPLMNPDGYKVLSPFSVTDRIPFLKVIDPGSRVEVYMTLKPFENDFIPDVFQLMDQIAQVGGTALGEDTGTYVLAQSGALGAVEEWYSPEITFELLGQYTLHVEVEVHGGLNYILNTEWEWLDPDNLAAAVLPIDQSPVVLQATQKNARGRLRYFVTFTDNWGPEWVPVADDIRLVQTYAHTSLDWGNLTVVNTMVRGIKLPRDVFQSFGEVA